MRRPVPPSPGQSRAPRTVPGFAPFLLLAAVLVCLAWARSSTAQAPEAAPPLPPLRAFGQVLGAVPTSLVAVLQPAGSSTVLATATATLVTTSGSTYYQAQFDGQSLKAALAASPRLAFNFRVDRADPGAQQLSLETTLSQFVVVHLRNKSPLASPASFLCARVDQTPDGGGQLRFTAVVAHAGSIPATGTLAWTPEPPTGPTVSTPLELGAGSVVVSRLTTAIPKAGTIPRAWAVSWTACSMLEPRLFRRVEAQAITQVLVDGIGPGPVLAEPPPLGPGSGSTRLDESTVSLDANDALSVQLETSLSPASVVRTALESWTVGPAAGPAPSAQGFALSRVEVLPMPAGGCWVRGTFVSPRARQIVDPALRGPAGATLPGTWRLRELAVLDRLEEQGNY